MALKPTNFPNGIKAPIVGANGSPVTSLTDSTGGTASATLAALAVTVTGVDGAGSNAASKADVDARLVVIRNALASLAAKVNALTGE